MSRTTTANYKTEAAKTSKSPVWIAKISGVGTYFCTGTFGDIDGDYKKILRNVQYSGSKIDLDLNTFEWGSLTFEIVDEDNVFTNLLDNPIAINNIKVELFHGYQALDVADFSQFPDMYIFKVRLSDDYLIYEVNATSTAFSLFEQTLFRDTPSTALDGGVVKGAVVMSVDKTDDFLGVTDMEGSNTYVEVGGGEIARYETKDDPNDDFEDMTRGARGYDQEWREDTVVKQSYSIVDTGGVGNHSGKYENPFFSLLGLLTTTSAGTNGNFDFGIAGYGLGIDESRINWQNIYRLGLEHFKGMDHPTVVRHFSGNVPENDTQKWLEDFFLKPMGALFFINDDGKLDVKLIDPLSYVSESKTLDNDNIISISDIEIRYDLIVNKLKYFVGSPLSDNFSEEFSYQNSTSVTAYNGSRVKQIFDKFVWNTGATNAFIKEYFFRKQFGAFGNPPVTAVFNVLDSKNAYSPGDWIDVTSTLLPDWVNGGRGISAIPFLVLEQWFEDDECFYKMVSYEAFQGVVPYTVNKITGGDIDDQLMTLEADNLDNNKTVNDAYDDNSELHSAELLRIRIDITPPGGAAGWKYVDLELKIQEVTGTDLFTRSVRIHYDPSWTDEFTTWFYLYWASGAHTYERIRADYIATDAAGGDVIAANNVKMTDIWFITENFTVAAL